MKIKTLLVTILLTTLFIGLNPQENVLKGDIPVSIKNIRAQKGNLFLALYKGEANFKSNENAQGKTIIPVKEDECTYLFKDIPYGNYAISLFHDKNGNKKIDKGLFGIPKEGYGFSNNAKMPKYKKASFDLKSVKYEVIIKLRY